MFGDSIESSLFHVAGSLSTDLSVGGFDTRLDTVLSFAGGTTEMTMILADPVGGAVLTQQGEADVSSLDWRARVAVDGRRGAAWPVSPFVEVGLSAYDQDEAVFGGGNATGLAVDELNNNRSQISLGVAYEHAWNDAFSLHASAAGVQYFGDTQNVFVSRFANGPEAGPAFETEGRDVANQFTVDASAAYRFKNGFRLDAGLFGGVGPVSQIGLNIALSKRF